MRENRPYGSEGGEGSTLPDPYHAADSDARLQDDGTCDAADHARGPMLVVRRAADSAVRRDSPFGDAISSAADVRRTRVEEIA